MVNALSRWVPVLGEVRDITVLLLGKSFARLSRHYNSKMRATLGVMEN